jgi:hypothetical protein
MIDNGYVTLSRSGNWFQFPNGELVRIMSPLEYAGFADLTEVFHGRRVLVERLDCERSREYVVLNEALKEVRTRERDFHSNGEPAMDCVLTLDTVTIAVDSDLGKLLYWSPAQTTDANGNTSKQQRIPLYTPPEVP